MTCDAGREPRKSHLKKRRKKGRKGAERAGHRLGSAAGAVREAHAQGMRDTLEPMHCSFVEKTRKGLGGLESLGGSLREDICSKVRRQHKEDTLQGPSNVSQGVGAKVGMVSSVKLLKGNPAGQAGLSRC